MTTTKANILVVDDDLSSSTRLRVQTRRRATCRHHHPGHHASAGRFHWWSPTSKPDGDGFELLAFRKNHPQTVTISSRVTAIEAPSKPSRWALTTTQSRLLTTSAFVSSGPSVSNPHPRKRRPGQRDKYSLENTPRLQNTRRSHRGHCQQTTILMIALPAPAKHARPCRSLPLSAATNRSSRPSALPETLLESELFGHVSAFTVL